MNTERVDEESLREFACLGDLAQIQTLLQQKPHLNINSQNAMNGWTALHWAAKRNHRQVVQYLLEQGAKKDIQAHDTSTAASVCTNESLREILETIPSDSKSIISSTITLPIVPNYLRHPTFPYLSTTSSSPSSRTTPIPVDTQTITLLARISNDPLETDFIEFDFSKSPIEGSYNRLIEILCEEFHLTHIVKVRRLPHIRIRHDRDVDRLKDNHMLEVIVQTRNESILPSDNS